MDWRYKGVTITISNEGTFNCDVLDMKNKSSLSAIKKAIDSALESVKSLKCYILDDTGNGKQEFKEIEVSHLSNYNWSGGGRVLYREEGKPYDRSVEMENCFEICNENKEKLRKINELESKREELKRAIDMLDSDIKEVKNNLKRANFFGDKKQDGLL